MKSPYAHLPRDQTVTIQIRVSRAEYEYLTFSAPFRGLVSTSLAFLFHRFFQSLLSSNLPPHDLAAQENRLLILDTATRTPLPSADWSRCQPALGRGTPSLDSQSPGRDEEPRLAPSGEEQGGKGTHRQDPGY